MHITKIIIIIGSVLLLMIPLIFSAVDHRNYVVNQSCVSSGNLERDCWVGMRANSLGQVIIDLNLVNISNVTNLIVNNNVTVEGNVSADYFFGNGTFLTGLLTRSNETGLQKNISTINFTIMDWIGNWSDVYSNILSINNTILGIIGGVTAGDVTRNISTLNQSLDTKMNVSGGVFNSDINISSYSIDFNDFSLGALEGNDNINGPVFGINMSGPSGSELPHFVVQSGGSSQASYIMRSLMIVNEIPSFFNTTNRTDCSFYMDEIGEDLMIDCNTTTTGADLLVSDDMQVVGDTWLKDTDNEWHFMTRELELQDELRVNTLLSRINSTMIYDNLTIEESHGKTLVVNINENNTILDTGIDSIRLTEGTNSSPNFIHVYYQNTGDPSLTQSLTPKSNVPDVAQLKFGANYSYGDIISSAGVEKFIRGVYHRFYDDGSIYISGFNINATSTYLNISSGVMKIMLQGTHITSNFSTEDLSIHIHADGTFHQHTSLNDFDTYDSGEVVSNNKYYSIVFGIVHTSDGTGRMYGVVQSKPPTEFTKAIDAETDITYVNLFPADPLIKKLFIPVARVIVQRVGADTVVKPFTNGLLYSDLRGTVTTSGGSAPTPGITSHSDLSNLDFDNSGHIGFASSDQLDGLNDSLNSSVSGNVLRIDKLESFSGDATRNISTLNKTAMLLVNDQDVFGVKRFHNSVYFLNDTYLTGAGVNFINESLVLTKLDGTPVIIMNASHPTINLLVDGNVNFTGNLEVIGTDNQLPLGCGNITGEDTELCNLADDLENPTNASIQIEITGVNNLINALVDLNRTGTTRNITELRTSLGFATMNITTLNLSFMNVVNNNLTNIYSNILSINQTILDNSINPDNGSIQIEVTQVSSLQNALVDLNRTGTTRNITELRTSLGFATMNITTLNLSFMNVVNNNLTNIYSNILSINQTILDNSVNPNNASIDHGSIGGLTGGNDHPQYFNPVNASITITAAQISDQHANTDITADLEEELHCDEHDGNYLSCDGEELDVSDSWVDIGGDIMTGNLQIDTTDDPSLIFDSDAEDRFTLCSDDADSYAFKISEGGTCGAGANDRIKVYASGNVEIIIG